jgi:hypothetical protein
MIGGSKRGYSRILKYRNPITPNITMTRLITMARTGRLILVEDKLIIVNRVKKHPALKSSGVLT